MEFDETRHVFVDHRKRPAIAQLSDKMHLLTAKIAIAEGTPSMHGGPDPLSPKLNSHPVVDQCKSLTDEFKGIQARPRTMSKFMKWSGISLTLVGLAGWYAVSQSR